MRVLAEPFARLGNTDARKQFLGALECLALARMFLEKLIHSKFEKATLRGFYVFVTHYHTECDRLGFEKS